MCRRFEWMFWTIYTLMHKNGADDGAFRYIKELADRVQNLEGSLQVQQGIEIPPQQYFQHESPQQQRASEEFLPSEDSMQRKRTFSAVSGELGAPYQPQRPVTGWAPQELPRHLPHPSATYVTPHSATPSTATLFREPHYSPDGLQPSPQWRNAPEPVPHQGSSFESMPQIDHSLLDRAPEWDESIVDGYVMHIRYDCFLNSVAYFNLDTTISYNPRTLFSPFLRASCDPRLLNTQQLCTRPSTSLYMPLSGPSLRQVPRHLSNQTLERQPNSF